MATHISRIVTPLAPTGPTYAFQRPAGSWVLLVCGGRFGVPDINPVVAGFHVDVKWWDEAGAAWVTKGSFDVVTDAPVGLGNYDVCRTQPFEVLAGFGGDYSVQITLLANTIPTSTPPKALCSVVIIDADAPPSGGFPALAAPSGGGAPVSSAPAPRAMLAPPAKRAKRASRKG